MTSEARQVACAQDNLKGDHLGSGYPKALRSQDDQIWRTWDELPSSKRTVLCGVYYNLPATNVDHFQAFPVGVPHQDPWSTPQLSHIGTQIRRFLQLLWTGWGRIPKSCGINEKCVEVIVVLVDWLYINTSNIRQYSLFWCPHKKNSRCVFQFLLLPQSFTIQPVHLFDKTNSKVQHGWRSSGPSQLSAAWNPNFFRWIFL